MITPSGRVKAFRLWLFATDFTTGAGPNFSTSRITMPPAMKVLSPQLTTWRPKRVDSVLWPKWKSADM